MTTTAVRTALRERIDPVLEEMITRELIGQGAPPPVFLGARQQPGAQLAALAPALIAAIASQQLQQVPVLQPQPPLATLAPALAATLAGEPQPIPMQQPQPLATLLPALLAAVAGQGPQQSPLAALLPILTATLAAKSQPIPVQQPQPLAALIAAIACQPQQVPVQQLPSPLATLFPVLMATVAMQQQPARLSPLVSALVPTIVSALTGRPREGMERETGERPERPGR